MRPMRRKRENKPPTTANAALPRPCVMSVQDMSVGNAHAKRRRTINEKLEKERTGKAFILYIFWHPDVPNSWVPLDGQTYPYRHDSVICRKQPQIPFRNTLLQNRRRRIPMQRRRYLHRQNHKTNERQPTKQVAPEKSTLPQNAPVTVVTLKP